VTMRYLRRSDGSLEPLPQRSVDTGMGLERLQMVVQGTSAVFDTDVFEPWMSTLPGLWQPDGRSLRLIADHLRASMVIIGDGVRPSNSGRGYVLRRLIRRVLTALWREDRTRSLGEIPSSLIEHTAVRFDQPAHSGSVRAVLQDEEQRFARLLDRAHKVLARFGPDRPPTADDLVYLHETHGLPPDLVAELLAEPGHWGTCQADRSSC